MNPHVIKAEGVFQRIIELRRAALFSKSIDEKREQELTKQIMFLFTIAEQHEEIKNDSRYKVVKKKLEQLNKKIEES